MARNGLFDYEKEICTINATSTLYNNYREEVKFSGELVLTEDSIIFLKATGRLKSGRERLHYLSLGLIDGIRKESKGISVGSMMGKVKLIIAVSDETRRAEYEFSCGTEDCHRFLKKAEEELKYLQLFHEFERRVIHLIKPKQEVSLREIAKDSELIRITQSALDEDYTSAKLLKNLQNVVSNMIVEGELDGVLEDDTYISNAKLSRKTVQYQVTIDFTSLFAQLKNKGIVLQKIECPSCKGELEFPENGTSIVCKFCNSTVYATDIFEKFKTLL